MRGYGETGAKLILTGEHAVVYGVPSIAIPFNALNSKVTITYSKCRNSIDSKYYQGFLEEGIGKVDGIIALVKHVNDYLNNDNNNLHIKIDSNIPIGRGLGSSASVSISIIKALFDYYNEELTNDLLIELAMYAERIHHTNPSGIDVNVLVYNKPVYFIKDETLELLDINLTGSLIVVDSGKESNTKDSVNQVKELIFKGHSNVLKEFDNIKLITNQVKELLANNNLHKLGELLTSNHQALINLGLSSDDLNAIQKDLISLGALGSKLTGAGLGGCVIGLFESKKEALKASEDLKEYNTYMYNFGDNNES